MLYVQSFHFSQIRIYLRFNGKDTKSRNKFDSSSCRNLKTFLLQLNSSVFYRKETGILWNVFIRVLNFKRCILSYYCFRPCDRNVKDVELVCARLRRVEQLCRLPNSVLQQLALCGYYEDLEKGVTCE